MNENIELNICLEDIPAAGKFTANNGKTYVKARLIKRKETGRYGETHFICLPSKKDEKTVYIGSAKPIDYTPNQPTANEIANATPANSFSTTDDLPF